MKKFIVLLTLFLLVNKNLISRINDFTIGAGCLIEADGFSRFPIQLIEKLIPHTNLNFFKLNDCSTDQLKISSLAQAIISKPCSKDKIGKVILIYDYINACGKDIDLIPDNRIRIAYTMFETSSIPLSWANMLNRYDALVVPDQFLKDTYQKSGVSVPIFVIPLGSKLEAFFEQEPKRQRNKPFVFGSLVHMQPRKNLKALIEAFAREFRDSKDVKLVLNSRNLGITTNYPQELKQLISRLKTKNIFVTTNTYSWSEYINTMKTFDCYVNIAKGEGFSISPREALALGIPCILSNNTAQITLCNSGFVRPVETKIREQVINFYPEMFGEQDLGYFFNSSITEIKRALRDVYTNFEEYLIKAHEGREWVKQFDWSNLIGVYLNLIKPKKIELGTEDIITKDLLKTSSLKLYKKYQAIKNVNL